MDKRANKNRILVIGGAGYVGSVLAPKLLDLHYPVSVLDTFWFGKNVFNGVARQIGGEDTDDSFFLFEGDARNYDLRNLMSDCDTVIHLACISNDPSFELNPKLGRSINYDAFLRVLDAALAAKVRRFIYASSSSVYGIKENQAVTEELSLEPITDYSKFKAFCEMELRMVPQNKMEWVVVRPATVCGWSPRLRLDLTVNILTISALTKKKITVFGGTQKRPNIHIEDMADLYVRLLTEPSEKIGGKFFNAGTDNLTIMRIAEMVKEVVESYGADSVEIEATPTNDLRSYHVSSDKIRRELGWKPRFGVKDAIRDLCEAYFAGNISDPADPKYYNIKVMQKLLEEGKA